MSSYQDFAVVSSLFRSFSSIFTNGEEYDDEESHINEGGDSEAEEETIEVETIEEESIQVETIQVETIDVEDIVEEAIEAAKPKPPRPTTAPIFHKVSSSYSNEPEDDSPSLKEPPSVTFPLVRKPPLPPKHKEEEELKNKGSYKPPSFRPRTAPMRPIIHKIGKSTGPDASTSNLKEPLPLVYPLRRPPLPPKRKAEEEEDEEEEGYITENNSASLSVSSFKSHVSHISQMEAQDQLERLNSLNSQNSENSMISSKAEQVRLQLLAKQEITKILDSVKLSSSIPSMSQQGSRLHDTMSTIKRECATLRDALQIQGPRVGDQKMKGPNQVDVESALRDLRLTVEGFRKRITEVEGEKAELEKLHATLISKLKQENDNSKIELVQKCKKAEEALNILKKKHAKEIKELKILMLNKETNYNRTFVELKRKYGDRIDNLTKTISKIELTM